jgi:hypothetical protein
VWRIDCRPAARPKVSGSVQVSVCGIAASLTEKEGLGRAISGFNMSTMGAFTRRVSGVYLSHRNTCENGLVKYKHLQLKKRPTVQNYSLRMPNLYPVTNALKFFKCNTASGAFGVATICFEIQ